MLLNQDLDPRYLGSSSERGPAVAPPAPVSQPPGRPPSSSHYPPPTAPPPTSAGQPSQHSQQNSNILPPTPMVNIIYLKIRCNFVPILILFYFDFWSTFPM